MFFCLFPYFAIKDDVLATTQNWLSAHLVAWGLKLKNSNNKMSDTDLKNNFNHPRPIEPLLAKQLTGWWTFKKYYRFNVLRFIVEYFR